MKRCEDVDGLVTPFVDGEASADETREVAEHIGACSPCRWRIGVESTARTVVRTHAPGLVTAAPIRLHGRCRAARKGWVRRTLAHRGLAAAAALVLALVGAFAGTAIVNPPVAVAAQLTLDHVKCFGLFESGQSLEPTVVANDLRTRYGWAIRLPEPAEAGGLRLVGGRRCVYLDGVIAHLLYRDGAEAISVFVLPVGARLPRPRLELAAYSAVSFARDGRTWVVMGRRPMDDVVRVATVFEEAGH